MAGGGSDAIAAMLQAAQAARANAHAPYSAYPVGACLRTAANRLFSGCNVENASYPEGLCAEAVAIGCMVASGEREIVEVLLIGGGELCTPCGGCRQKLAEFAGPEVPVHLCAPDGRRRTVSLGELLPLGFGARQLRPQ